MLCHIIYMYKAVPRRYPVSAGADPGGSHGQLRRWNVCIYIYIYIYMGRRCFLCFMIMYNV